MNNTEMLPFLYRVAEAVKNRFNGAMEKVCVVLPNRRAGLYFSKYLAQQTDVPIFQPGIYSIKDFMVSLSGYSLMNELALQLHLFRVYCAVEKEHARSFEDFAGWAPTLLSDFIEADQSLADIHGLFTGLTEEKALAQWNLDGSPLTPFQKNYLRFFASMLPMYNGLQEVFTRERSAHYGYISRMAATNENKAFIAGWKHIVFAGLSALTTAEEKTVEKLIADGMATVYWDIDNHMLAEGQESGSFIRRYLKKWPVVKDFEPVSLLGSAPKNIRIVGVPGNVMQAKTAAGIISRMFSGDEGGAAPEQTAVVLSDESLLLPLLNSMPPTVESFNVTMGFPARHSAAYNLAGIVFDLRENAQRFTSLKSSSKTLFYLRDIISLLGHPFIALYLGHDEGSFAKSPIQTFITSLLASNRMLYTADHLRSLLSAAGIINSGKLDLLFEPWGDDGRKAARGISQFFALLLKAAADHPVNPAEVAVLSGISSRLNDISDAVGAAGEWPLGIRALRSLFRSQVSGMSIPFTGEPLSGLQVMGMLESRALDFETVVLLSASEGILPSAKSNNSFIPYDLRRATGLPTWNEREAIFAYHFYHLLLRCRNMVILYNNDQNGKMGGGELSRYVRQIMQELPTLNPSVRISLEQPSLLPSVSSFSKEFSVEKTDAIMELLQEKAKKGLSPSSVNVFRACPLWFAMQEVMGFRKEEEAEETVDSRTFGSILHYVLEQLFKPLAGKILDRATVKDMYPRIEALTEEAFRVKYSDGDYSFGKNLLVMKVAVTYLKSYLGQLMKEMDALEKQKAGIRPLEVEYFMSREITVEVNGSAVKVNLKGIADRIDHRGDAVYILDFKSGKVDAAGLNVEAWDQFQHDVSVNKAFQLLFYAWLATGTAGKEKLRAGIISFRNVSNGIMPLSLPGSGTEISAGALEEFRAALDTLVREMFDRSVAFGQTTQPENCRWCPFAVMCGRVTEI